MRRDLPKSCAKDHPGLNAITAHATALRHEGDRGGPIYTGAGLFVTGMEYQIAEPAGENVGAPNYLVTVLPEPDGASST
jgi:hypothetical protein